MEDERLQGMMAALKGRTPALVIYVDEDGDLGHLCQFSPNGDGWLELIQAVVETANDMLRCHLDGIDKPEIPDAS